MTNQVFKDDLSELRQKVQDQLKDAPPDEQDTTPCPITARDMPDQRLDLMSKWTPDGIFTKVVNIVGNTATESYTDYRKLEEAELYWVSPDTCATVWSAYETYPDDTILDPTFIPSTSGFVVFGEPFIGHDADQGTPIRVDAVCWGPVKLVSRTTGAKGRGISLTSYRWMPEHHILVVLGRADWLYGHRIDAQSFIDDPLPDSQHASIIEDRKVFATLASLIQNPRVVDNEPTHPPRYIHRRSTRAGIDPNKIRVHTLRVRGENDKIIDADTGEVRTYRHRWIVRPHWRMQAYGPGRKLRKPILVPPHVKGPSGAPLLNPKNRVNKF